MNGKLTLLLGNIHILPDFSDDGRLKKASMIQVWVWMRFTTQVNLGALGFRRLNAVLERPKAITRDHRSYVYTGSNTIGRQTGAHAEVTSAGQDKLVNLIVLRCVNEQPFDANAILTCILTANFVRAPPPLRLGNVQNAAHPKTTPSLNVCSWEYDRRVLTPQFESHRC